MTAMKAYRFQSRVVSSPLGPLQLYSDGYSLTCLEFVGRESHSSINDKFNYEASSRNEASPVLDQAERELQEYFRGTRQEFDVPVLLSNPSRPPSSTPFQTDVWKQLRRIPYGTVCSYKDIAVGMGKPGAVRAVGGANSKNPIPIIVPCHRVICANGTIGGFHSGQDLKERLLELEGVSLKKRNAIVDPGKQ